MKRYLVLYRATTSAKEMMSKATPEQTKAVMDAWFAWAKKAGSAIVELGAPTGQPQKYTSSKSSTKGGDESIGGYSILQADSKSALDAVLEGHPHFSMPGSAIEVHELLPM